MAKIVKFTVYGCDDCQSFNYGLTECNQTGSAIDFDTDNQYYKIPDDCPLEDAEED